MSALRAAALVMLALALAACGNGDGRLQGWVEGDFVFVGPDEAGRVETLNVREGDPVAAGAPLFAVDADLQ
jgi:HlyD family secretion protein